MSEPTTHLGTETIPSTGYFEPRQFRLFFRCDVCGHEWERTYKKIPTRDPACPEPACKELRDAEREARNAERFEQMLEERRGPAQIGNKTIVKAVDKTAEIVMADYGMTDLRDNVREGDTVAPKLPTAHVDPVSGRTVNQQAMADSYFDSKAFARTARIDTARAELLKRRAIAGQFRHTAVNPKIATYGHASGDRALRKYAEEKIG